MENTTNSAETFVDETGCAVDEKETIVFDIVSKIIKSGTLRQINSKIAKLQDKIQKCNEEIDSLKLEAISCDNLKDDLLIRAALLVEAGISADNIFSLLGGKKQRKTKETDNGQQI